MKLFKNITKGLIPAFASILIFALLAGKAYAIPYTGVNTPPSAVPAFNVFTGVPSEGNESDFFRGKVEGDTNASVNDVRSTCETGKRFTLRVYVHNGASQDNNGNGSGASVAKNTKVKVDLKNAVAKSGFAPDATISSSNAAAKSDGMSITCTDGKVVKLSYVKDTAKQFTSAGTQSLSNDIVTTGAAIGTKSPDGNVWGCWEQRVYVTLTVEVKEAPVVIPTDAICKIENGGFVVIDNKKRTVSGTIKPQLTNATVTKYLINWGDGTVTNNQSGTHSYAADGKYTITATMDVRLNDGTVKTVGGSACMTTVEFKPGQPPVVVVPPTTTVVPPTVTKLVSTGPASIFSIFAATSLVGAVMHRIYTARKATQL